MAVSVRAPEIAPKAVFLAAKPVDKTEGRRNCLLNNAEEERRGAESTMMKIEI